MSVSAAAAITASQQLVQITDLDPKRFIVMSGSVAGDGSGGSSIITATVPAGNAAFIIRMNSNISGTGTASNLLYRVVFNGATINDSARAPLNVTGFQRYEDYTPAPVLWIPDTLAVSANVDNINTQTHSFAVLMYLWELQDARNLPQRFFWPGTLA